MAITLDGTDAVGDLGDALDAKADASALAAFMLAIAYERNSAGTASHFMALGNGASACKGSGMPFAGKIVAATLHGTATTGTITVDVTVDGTANTSYRLTGTGSASDINTTGDWRDAPLAFSAGAVLNFRQTAVPTTSSGYVATLFVVFD